jgi:hypothetical protein
MQPGMKKQKYVTKSEIKFVLNFKKYAIQCKNLAEVGKMSKQYAELFKDEYPEFYI